MKKILLILCIFLLVGCTNKLTCTITDEIGTGKMEFTFKNDSIIKLRSTLEFSSEDDAKAVCSLYKDIKIVGSKVICESRKVTLESTDVTMQYKDLSKKEIKKQLEEDGYSCK